jgi:uncharacterized membrane protein
MKTELSLAILLRPICLLSIVGAMGFGVVDAAAAPPSYQANFLGEGVGINAMNESAVIVGTMAAEGGIRGWVASVQTGVTLLPLPPSMLGSFANDINEAGVIVGAVSQAYSPEFGGEAAVWIPDGAGGYTTALLGKLPGHVRSNATAVNNLGDIVGYSSDGTFRLPVLFTAPGGVQDLSPTGIFDPKDINDQRVVVDDSFTVKRLDLDTMIVEDLGVPPAGSQSYRATSSEAINESNQVAGLAILATSTDCDREAARFTDGVGWEILSGCGSSNGATDINDLGDVVMRLNVAPYVFFEGVGTFRIEDLIVEDVGHWFLVNAAPAINSSQQIAVFAHNTTTGESGIVLLTPEPALALSGPTPGIAGAPNSLQATGASPLQKVYFVAGRRGGTTVIPICTGLTLGIAAPQLLGLVRADATGTATIQFLVPTRAQGFTVLFQAFDRASCTTSNLVTYTFP